MTNESRNTLLIESVRVLVARYPSLHVWFIGDGPHRDSIYAYLRGEGVRASIAMPGSFADTKDLFIAADVYVQSQASGLDSFLRQAVSADLPIVAADNESTRAVLGPSARVGQDESRREWVSWYQPNQIKSFRAAVRNVLDDRSRSTEHAIQLRRWLCRQRPQMLAVDAYVQLIERLASSRRDHKVTHRTKTTSIETAS